MSQTNARKAPKAKKPKSRSKEICVDATRLEQSNRDLRAALARERAKRESDPTAAPPAPRVGEYGWQDAATGGAHYTPGPGGASATSLGYRARNGGGAFAASGSMPVEQYRAAVAAGTVPSSSPFAKVAESERQMTVVSVTTSAPENYFVVPLNPLRDILALANTNGTLRFAGRAGMKRSLAAVTSAILPLFSDLRVMAGGSSNQNARAGVIDTFLLVEPIMFADLQTQLEDSQFMAARYSRTYNMRSESVDLDFPLVGISGGTAPLPVTTDSALTSHGARYAYKTNFMAGAANQASVSNGSLNFPINYDGKVTVQLAASWNNAASPDGISVMLYSYNSTTSVNTQLSLATVTNGNGTNDKSISHSVTFDLADYNSAAVMLNIYLRVESGGAVDIPVIDVAITYEDWCELDNYNLICRAVDFSGVADEASWTIESKSSVSFAHTLNNAFAGTHSNEHWLSPHDHLAAQLEMLSMGRSAEAASFKSILRKARRGAKSVIRGVAPFAPPKYNAALNATSALL